MNGKSTGRALMLSFISLVLCLTMLVGTTFAWFTDTVTSANNLIVAGNLDIEMDYSTNLVDWNDVTEAGDLFISPNGAEKGLWEPGHTEVAYLRITNAGSLALEYQLKVNPYKETIGKNAEGKDIKLSEVLKFSATEASATVPALYTRETAQEAAMKADGTKLTEYTTKVTTMAPGEVQYIALVVYMPETVGNEANYRGETRPEIDFALTLKATQVEAESDSFDKNYDKDASATVTYVSTPADLSKAIENGGSIQLMSDITFEKDDADTSIGYPVAILANSGKPVEIDLNGKTIKMESSKDDCAVIHALNTDVRIKGNGKIIQASEGAYCNLIWAKGSSNVIVESGEFESPNSSAVMLYSSNDGANKGTITILGGNFTSAGTTAQNHMNVKNHGEGKINILGGTFNFNPDWSVYTDVHAIDDRAHITVADGYIINDNGDGTWTVGLDNSSTANLITNATPGDTVTLPAGEYTLPSLSGKEGITIEGVEGTTIGGENAESGFSWSNFGKNNTYKNLDFTGTSNGTRYTYANGGTTTFENCTFAGDSTYGFHVDQSNGATFIFNNCTFSGFNAFAGDLEKVIFNNCTFLYNGNYGHTNIWSHAEFNECTWGDKTSVSGRGDTPTLVFDGVEESYHHEFIGSAESLVDFAATLESDHWKGQKVVLVDDIDLSSVTWNPIGAFAGTFDGNGHKITNLTVSGASNVGFFKSLSTTATVKNVVFDKANVSGEHYVGVVVGWEGNETVNAHIDNVTVQNSTITCDTDAANDNGDKAGAIAGYAVTLTIENCTVKDTTVKAYRDFGGILGYSNGANTIVRNNTVENVQLVIDNDVNYKNYTTDAEHDANAVVGELSKGKVENNIVK